MDPHRFLSRAAFLCLTLLAIFILSACNLPILNSSQPGPVLSGEQSLINVPGGLMVLEDGSGRSHPVLLYDYQIQSRLVTYDEFIQADLAGLPAGDEAIFDEATGIEEPAIPADVEGAVPAGVNWYQAQAYCESIGGRLPTEAELKKATHTDEACQTSEYQLGSQEGFGEWVYDWDQLDYYNESLVTNPFGPLYGDLKVVLGLDLEQLSETSLKYFYKSDGTIVQAKYDGKYFRIILDDGKLKFKSSETEWKFWQSVDETNVAPRIGILPENSSPLVGFRCVTQGVALAYAPICKASTPSNCTAPVGEQVAAVEGTTNPNFEPVSASCPEGGRMDITISHDLLSGEGVEAGDYQGACDCQEYPDYPGKLYCNCALPTRGDYLNVDVCLPGAGTPLSADVLCPAGYRFNALSLTCDRESQVHVYGLDADLSPEFLNCPVSASLPAPEGGYLGMTAPMVEGVSQSTVTEGDPWGVYSISDGSGMCPPGYAFNPDTSCCSPISEDNYGCEEGEYFDAGMKQCLPVHADGCGPCQRYDSVLGCVYDNGEKFISGRCTVDDSDMEFDDYGRPPGNPAGCDTGAYFDTDLQRCVETRDGCPVGYYLDPVLKTCMPTSGPAGLCSPGSIYNPVQGCCLPVPGEGGVTFFEGTEINESTCPPDHSLDLESERCLLREGGACPAGTSLSLIGKCIPDQPGICPEDFKYDPESDSCYRSGAEDPVCGAEESFNPSLGICIPAGSVPSGGLSSGRVECQVLDVTTTVAGKDNPDLRTNCFDPELDLTPLQTLSPATSGIIRCLILTADKSFQSGRGLCRPDPAGDEADERYFDVEIEEGRIASITRVSPDTLDPASAAEPPAEDACGLVVLFGEKPEISPEEAEDYWGDPESGRAGEDECTASNYIYFGGVDISQACSSFQIAIPSCTTEPESAPGETKDPCAGLDFNSCANKPECTWKDLMCVSK